MNNHFESQPSIRVCFYARCFVLFFNSELLLEYGQERTPQSTLNTLGVLFFLKGTGMSFMIGWLTAKLNQSGL